MSTFFFAGFSVHFMSAHVCFTSIDTGKFRSQGCISMGGQIPGIHMILCLISRSAKTKKQNKLESLYKGVAPSVNHLMQLSAFKNIYRTKIHMDNDMSIMCMVKISASVFLYVYLSVPLSHASSSPSSTIILNKSLLIFHVSFLCVTPEFN